MRTHDGGRLRAIDARVTRSRSDHDIASAVIDDVDFVGEVRSAEQAFGDGKDVFHPFDAVEPTLRDTAVVIGARVAAERRRIGGRYWATRPNLAFGALGKR